MNRRDVIKSAIAVWSVRPLIAVSANSTPVATPDIPEMNQHLYSPAATSIQTMTFRKDRTDTTDVIRFHYTIFEFASSDDAADNFAAVVDRIESFREEDSDFASKWSREVSIGRPGEDRIGFTQDDGEILRGVTVFEETMAAFTVVTPNPVAAYADIIQPILEESPSLALDLSDFPAGWRYEIEPLDVTTQYQ